MKYAKHTVAAAISNIADIAIREGGISVSDGDALALVMNDAERMVANQLVRQGMSLREAEDLASEASMLPGKETADSEELAQDAYQNRHASTPVPTPSTTPASVPEGDDGVEPVATNAQGAGQADTGRTRVAEERTPLMDIAPAPASLRTHLVKEVPPMEYEVVMKKVHELFRGIEPSDKLFDFEVPVLNWAGKHPKIPKIDSAYMFAHGPLHTALYAIATGGSVNIVGPHGCGKTQLVNQIAARLNYPVTTLPMDGQLGRRELIGQEKLRSTENGTESYFSAGLLPRALAEPGIILFDEVDRGTSDLQYACHSVYLEDSLSLLEDAGRLVPFHEYNRVFGTANTKGRGSLDGMYQPPEEMSEATRDRWSIWVEMGYPDVDEDATVLMNKQPGLTADEAKTIATVASQIRGAYNQGALSQTASMRQQLEVARMTVFLNRNEQDPIRRKKGMLVAFDRVIGGRASAEDQGAIHVHISTIMPEAFQGEALF